MDVQLSTLGERMALSMEIPNFPSIKNSLPQENFSVGDFDGKTANISS